MSEPQEMLDFKRGCGHLVPGGYYLSAVDSQSRTGSLLNVTFPFGNGLNHVVYGGSSVPTRGMLLIDPAATFTLQSVTTPGAAQIDDGDLYASLCRKVLDYGLIDHVGQRHYTAASFTAELFERMPNRRVHPNVARQLANKLPLPVIFTHSRIPVFRDEEEIARALAYCQEFAVDLELDHLHYGANWLRPEWGAFAKQDDGRDHFMIPILAMIDKITRDRQTLCGVGWWQEVFDFFDGLRYEEQPFAISWFTKALRIVDDGHQLTKQDENAGIRAATAVPIDEVSYEVEH